MITCFALNAFLSADHPRKMSAPNLCYRGRLLISRDLAAAAACHLPIILLWIDRSPMVPLGLHGLQLVLFSAVKATIADFSDRIRFLVDACLLIQRRYRLNFLHLEQETVLVYVDATVKALALLLAVL